MNNERLQKRSYSVISEPKLSNGTAFRRVNGTTPAIPLPRFAHPYRKQMRRSVRLGDAECTVPRYKYGNAQDASTARTRLLRRVGFVSVQQSLISHQNRMLQRR